MNRREPIAVVGVSTLFPGSVDSTSFWKDILEGADRITDVPATHWLIEDYYDPDPSAPDKTYARRGGFVPEVDFDPMKWGVPPSTVEATDTCQLLALIVAQRVLDDASRGQFDYADRDRMSVILGVTSAQELLGAMNSRLQRPVWTKALRDMGMPEDEVQEACARIESHYTPWQEATFPGVLGNVVAGRIANRLNLGGTNCVTDAACASTFSALSMAVNELYLGESDVVICGGADTMNDIFMYLCFSKTPALSKSGDCRPFSDQADGTMLGEGFGMVALKRLRDAERDGDRIYAVVRGVGSSSDGKGTAVYAPVASGQAKAIRRAYANAGYGPDTVELIEAHGTGTIAGDAAEFEGLKIVFEESGREDKQWCALGSVKSQVGHTKAAAGAAGLVKAIFALHHRVLPPTIKVDRPNPKLDLEQSPFHLSTRARPWVRSDDHPRRAGVSSFGFGGSNFHIAIEEYTGAGAPGFRRRATPDELFVLGAETAPALADAARAMAGELSLDGMFAYLARDTQERFDASSAHRLAVVATDADDLRLKLERAAELAAKGEPTTTPDGIAYGAGESAGDVAFLFPGQGSQYPSMGEQVAMAFDEAREPWDAAASLDRFDPPLHEVVFPRPAFDDATREAQADRLTRTEWAQPGIGVTSLSLLALLDELGVEPSAVAGHSFGEVIALHAAGVLSREDAIRVARERGERMAEAASVPGAMTAVVASVEDLRARLEGWGVDVVVANHNGPKQVVLSGPTDAIEQAEAKLDEAKLRYRRLDVATAFHSSVVSASTAPFGEFLSAIDVAPPECDVYGNTEAAPYPADPDRVRELLANQLANPVRFVESVEAMYEAGARVFVEVGPGSVLTGLTRRILGDRPHLAINLDRKGKHGVTALHHALASLSAAGVSLDLGALWRAYEPLEDPRTTKKPRMTMRIQGSNYGKPYPPPEGADGLPAPNPPRPSAPAQEAQTMSDSKQHPPQPRPAAPTPAATAAPAAPPAPQHAAPQAPPHAAPQGDAWASAYYAVQAKVIEAHTAYTQAIAATHGAFLAAQQQAMAAMPAMMHGQPMPQVAPPLPAHAPPAPQHAAPQAPLAQAYAPPAPAPQAPVAQAYAPPAPAPQAPAPAPHAPAAQAAPPAPAPHAAPGVDLQGLMLEVVADKTGYPVEMLELSMDLEGDLGVDSIKRVEILAAVREQATDLPEVDPAELGKLRTLQEIVDRLDAAPAGAPAARPAAAAAASPGVDLKALMLSVVADKTGYPAEMLELSMDLEGDLGVDSIKRVEILAAVREQATDLPEVDPAELGKLRTLQEIVDRLDAAPVGAPAASPAAAPVASPGVDLKALMLSVVADKTGYPAEMLELSMDLEGDLGVDSIKRVEILAAVREQATDLPEVDPAELGKLRTLQEIVDRLDAAPAGAAGAAPAPKPAAPISNETRWTLRLEDAPATGFALRGLFAARSVVVVDGGSGVADALVERLKAYGVPARAGAPDASSDGVVFLGGLAPLDGSDAALAVQRDAFAAAKAVAERLAAHGGFFVTVQDTGGDFGLTGAEHPWLGGLPGLVKTAAQEWPEAGLRAIDLERAGRDASALAGLIAEELLRGGAPEHRGASGGGAEVAIAADGRRRTLISAPAKVEPAATRVDDSSVIVASGGARGVTATTLIALAEASRCKLVLLGRTALEDEPAACAGATTDAELKRALLEAAKAAGEALAPKELNARARRILAAREVRETLAAIERAGGKARYVPTDVRDAAAVAAALEPIRAEWGPITGIVHGAGVLADRLIAEKPLEDFDRVFDVKVRGLRALLDATANDPLAVLVAFSSVAGRCGNRGQCDYAMANETLSKVVAAESARRGGALFSRSLGWGPWDGGMVTPALKQHFESLGVPLIAPADGAKWLVDELSDTSDSIELVLGGEPRPAALSGAATSAGERLFDVVIDRAGFPAIEDHKVKGKPVLPVALVLELFARAVEATRPDLVFTACEDVEVLRGVVLERYEGEGDRLQVRSALLSNGEGIELKLELLDAQGHVRYRARGWAQRVAATPSAPPAAPSDLGPFEGEVYDGVALFHGDAFQVIVGAPQIGESGLEATVEGASARGWPQDGWATDPALVDGGLQLALLWTCASDGGAALPTSVKRYRRFARGLVGGPTRAVLVGHARSRDKSTSDVIFVDDNGAPVAELEGVEMHVLPGSRATN